MTTHNSEQGESDTAIRRFLQPLWQWELAAVNIETLEITLRSPNAADAPVVLNNRQAMIWLHQRRYPPQSSINPFQAESVQTG